MRVRVAGLQFDVATRYIRRPDINHQPVVAVARIPIQECGAAGWQVLIRTRPPRVLVHLCHSTDVLHVCQWKPGPMAAICPGCLAAGCSSARCGAARQPVAPRAGRTTACLLDHLRAHVKRNTPRREPFIPLRPDLRPRTPQPAQPRADRGQPRARPRLLPRVPARAAARRAQPQTHRIPRRLEPLPRARPVSQRHSSTGNRATALARASALGRV